MAEENKIRDAVDATTGLVKAVPIYQDVVQPAAREIGHVAGRAVRAALGPLRGLIWGAEAVEAFLEAEVGRRLSKVPAERIIEPNLMVAGPLAQALVFAGHQPELAAMFAALLATAMDAESAPLAHPAFVEFIRQLQPDEAKVLQVLANGEHQPLIDFRAEAKDRKGFVVALRNFGLIGYEARCQHPLMLAEYLDNLSRLRLVEVQELRLTREGAYEPLEAHDALRALLAHVPPERSIRPAAKLVLMTDLGKQFCRACGVQPLVASEVVGAESPPST